MRKQSMPSSRTVTHEQSPDDSGNEGRMAYPIRTITRSRDPATGSETAELGLVSERRAEMAEIRTVLSEILDHLRKLRSESRREPQD